jgi:hypothetical protein
MPSAVRRGPPSSDVLPNSNSNTMGRQLRLTLPVSRCLQLPTSQAISVLLAREALSTRSPSLHDGVICPPPGSPGVRESSHRSCFLTCFGV